MEIQVSGISCMTLIGHHEYERVDKQEVIIDVNCEVYQFDWISGDRIENTLCFDILTGFIKEIVVASSFYLLEGLAQHIIAQLFEKFNNVISIDIRIFKPQFCGLGADKMAIRLFEKRKFKVAVAIGSNSKYLPKKQLVIATEILGSYIDKIKMGGFYETKPVGYTDQRNFINTVIVGFTTLMPQVLFSKLKKVEKLMGKEEIMIDGPRVIDLDLIFYADLEFKYNFIQVPHAAMHERDFVLQPLVDVEPSWQHPVFNRAVKDLLDLIPQDKRSIIAKIV